jgi:hypothetical protein
MKSLLTKAMIGSAGLVLFSSSAMAAWTFGAADLVIGFQATGGQGATTNLFYNIGNSYDFYTEITPYGVVGNINDDLVATYGSNWSSRTDLYFGVIANRSNLTVGLEPGTPGESDPGRTLYVSAPTLTIGGAPLRPQLGSGSLGTTGTNYSGLKNVLVTLTETAFGDGVAALTQATQPSQFNNNGWSKWNPTPGAAFGTLTGGIQQRFGQSGPDNIVDLQRMVANTTSEYVGSVIIGDNGSITVVPEPSTSLLAALAAGIVGFRRRRNA